MNTQITLDQLKHLRLNGMADAYQAVLSSQVQEQPSIHQFIARLTEAETQHRVHLKTHAYLKLSKLRYNAVMEQVYCNTARNLTQEHLLSISDCVDHPISLYAATKKSNELMAHAYSHLYNIQTVGLRFFTVYGPWGRPDMAPFLFTEAIVKQKPIQVFNQGNLQRDFTYIDDIVEGINALASTSSNNKYRIFNLGNNAPIKLLDFIHCLENELGKTAIKEMVGMQPGDVVSTCADTTELIAATGYKPKTNIQEGVKKFIQWYKEYYKIGI